MSRIESVDISNYEWVEISFLSYQDDTRRDVLHYWSIEVCVDVTPSSDGTRRERSRIVEKIVQDGQIPETRIINHYPSIVYSGPANPLSLRGKIQYYSSESLLTQIEFDR